MNNVTLLGNISSDIRVFPAREGMTGMATFSIAINEKYKDRNGNKVEKVSFVDCRIHGVKAEVFAKYVAKGHKIALSGKLEQRSWEKDGKKHYALGVTVLDFDFLQPKAAAPAPAQTEMAAA